ncbi:hypothetical protein LOZ12_005141 [Ophidiomyces ophidiicola]|uniref:Uncharacterized protein n=1 Tax=Ophidiomyces ophidiicola TaxID=1387563 RepID=A0ACB8UQ39_9EURO|nr:uncharacterized protein LOZ57_006729 [Ophidiomyces ophidiicola]KAI1907404.1 hypothetical protein LOZ64_005901 [Ophidiomyces ophidiicola]KAI1936750.1 hypothetical protein LOZ57_006729 [Ophidiomyces ophidiicola]KAI1941658.1 hypothetical protein LOZ62_004722 [Ophidiomyces ophidiicola]KAI1961648.1 hypothetical protein LOZ59_002297 [Ophidiomyces ophidiicola]KAI2001921.1 hypothetical protein LOZ50_005355 [Ophidiomyces ophidiicola]
MASPQKPSPHGRAPAIVREVYNGCRRLDPTQIASHPNVVDLQQRQGGEESADGTFIEKPIPWASLESAFDGFMGDGSWRVGVCCGSEDVRVYGLKQVPGLQIIPSLLPPSIQVGMLSRLLHRDLSDERHQTNLHLHYHISYPSSPLESLTTVPEASDTRQDAEMNTGKSFFADDPARLLLAKDSTVHRPMSIKIALNGKLRWMTLGGQYNWTSKEYPPGPPPPFPSDIAKLLRGIFPQTTPEAAIVNLYSSNDTLYPHRDVSEDCDTGLISISFGCDGLFLVGHTEEDGCSVIRLRSGDAVYMSGASRFAWHAVPKILPSTCPGWLASWPGGDDSSKRFQQWQGWMAGKRVNLNVRQMFQHTATAAEDA